MEKDIGKVKKNDATDIIIRIDDFGGKKGLTIREYTKTEKYTGFTKSGTRIPAEAFKDFRTLINSIYDDDLEPEPRLEPPSDDSEESKKEKHKKSKESKKSNEAESEDEDDEEEDEDKDFF